MINIAELQVPAGVEVVQGKTSIKFVKGEKKAYLKGSNLEITNPIKALGSRVKAYSAEIIEKCHLGSVQACIPSVADTIDLQKILNRYFKAK